VGLLGNPDRFLITVVTVVDLRGVAVDLRLAQRVVVRPDRGGGGSGVGRSGGIAP
jgi:hypothetical protein